MWQNYSFLLFWPGCFPPTCFRVLEWEDTKFTIEDLPEAGNYLPRVRRYPVLWSSLKDRNKKSQSTLSHRSPVLDWVGSTYFFLALAVPSLPSTFVYESECHMLLMLKSISSTQLSSAPTSLTASIALTISILQYTDPWYIGKQKCECNIMFKNLFNQWKFYSWSQKDRVDILNI